ncbi:MAG: zinc ribbon domain-containing protein [Thiobacillus sp.]|nr:zinc ribbon domain-containing protein [Thiobacillus sp.]
MPIYDYECRRCSKRFEALLPIGAPAPRCSNCNSVVRKLVLAAPVVHGGMAHGRERAMSSLPVCGKGCSCCPPKV